jgi:hypothetical protein
MKLKRVGLMSHDLCILRFMGAMRAKHAGVVSFWRPTA